MAKQKMVMKVQMADSKKRAKALRTAAGLPGVVSAEIKDDQITVVGDGVDSVELTMVLRKKMGFAELVSVAAVEEKKEEKKAEEKKKGEAAKSEVQPVMLPYQYYTMAPPQYIYDGRDHYNDSCSIM